MPIPLPLGQTMQWCCRSSSIDLPVVLPAPLSSPAATSSPGAAPALRAALSSLRRLLRLPRLLLPLLVLSAAAAAGRGVSRGRLGGLDLLPGLVLVVGVLLLMEHPQPLGLLDVGLPVDLREQLPPPAELLGDLGVVLVGVDGDDLAPLQLRPDHEGVHRPLDVVWGMLLGLEEK